MGFPRLSREKLCPAKALSLQKSKPNMGRWGVFKKVPPLKKNLLGIVDKWVLASIQISDIQGAKNSPAVSWIRE
jgi:hypothetical protein